MGAFAIVVAVALLASCHSSDPAPAAIPDPTPNPSPDPSVDPTVAPTTSPNPNPNPNPRPACWYERAGDASPQVVVYGATASGVIAATEAARHGLRVTLLEPGSHVGGMTSGGLGRTDIGIADSVGGLARAFYEAVGARYGASTPVYDFEPHVAETIFRGMLADRCVQLVPDARVTSVTRSGSSITSVTTALDASFVASVFIDASYEGDLLARAQVPFTVGREANATYGETRNGIGAAGMDTSFKVDPYVIPSTPSSGLLPHIMSRPVFTIGGADDNVEAYNYRLCVTDDPANSRPFPAARNYDPAEFEVLARWFDGMQARGDAVRFGDVVFLGPLPNRKYDLNNNGFFSTDLVGGSKAYPAADFVARDAIVDAHKEYTRGFFQFLATSPRVPAQVRAEVGSYGLCADEFVDTGGWPHQLYVREARRMLGAYVMTEHDIKLTTPVDDPVALGSYPLDSHYTQRMALFGAVFDEGLDYSLVSSPYPISFRVLTPREQDVANLLVSVCVSASHAAWKSIRMEPVFMELGHAAGAAAALAIQHGTSVQTVQYPELADLLRAEGQRLTWP